MNKTFLSFGTFHTREHRLVCKTPDQMRSSDIEPTPEKSVLKKGPREVRIQTDDDVQPAANQTVNHIRAEIGPQLSRINGHKLGYRPHKDHLGARSDISKTFVESITGKREDKTEPKQNTYWQSYAKEEARDRMPSPVQPPNSNKNAKEVKRAFTTRTCYNRVDGLHYQFWNQERNCWEKGPTIQSPEQIRAERVQRRYEYDRDAAQKAAEYKAAGILLADWDRNRNDPKWAAMARNQRVERIAADWDRNPNDPKWGMSQAKFISREKGMPLPTIADDQYAKAPESVRAAQAHIVESMRAFEEGRTSRPTTSFEQLRQINTEQMRTFNDLAQQWNISRNPSSLTYHTSPTGDMLVWRQLPDGSKEGMAIDKQGIARSLGISQEGSQTDVRTSYTPSSLNSSTIEASPREYTTRALDTAIMDAYRTSDFPEQNLSVDQYRSFLRMSNEWDMTPQNFARFADSNGLLHVWRKTGGTQWEEYVIDQRGSVASAGTSSMSPMERIRSMNESEGQPTPAVPEAQKTPEEQAYWETMNALSPLRLALEQAIRTSPDAGQSKEVRAALEQMNKAYVAFARAHQRFKGQKISQKEAEDHIQKIINMTDTSGRQWDVQWNGTEKDPEKRIVLRKVITDAEKKQENYNQTLAALRPLRDTLMLAVKTAEGNPQESLAVQRALKQLNDAYKAYEHAHYQLNGKHLTDADAQLHVSKIPLMKQVDRGIDWKATWDPEKNEVGLTPVEVADAPSAAPTELPPFTVQDLREFLAGNGEDMTKLYRAALAAFGERLGTDQDRAQVEHLLEQALDNGDLNSGSLLRVFVAKNDIGKNIAYLKRMTRIPSLPNEDKAELEQRILELQSLEMEDKVDAAPAATPFVLNDNLDQTIENALAQMQDFKDLMVVSVTQGPGDNQQDIRITTEGDVTHIIARTEGDNIVIEDVLYSAARNASPLPTPRGRGMKLTPDSIATLIRELRAERQATAVRAMENVRAALGEFALVASEQEGDQYAQSILNELDMAGTSLTMEQLSELTDAWAALPDHVKQWRDSQKISKRINALLKVHL